MWDFFINMALPGIVIFVALELAHRRGYVKGKRDKQFTWRCPMGDVMMVAPDPEELLLASVEHMKGHTNGDTRPEEV